MISEKENPQISEELSEEERIENQFRRSMQEDDLRLMVKFDSNSIDKLFLQD